MARHRSGPSPGKQPKTLIELEPCMCRWPVSGQGADTLFCSALVEREGAPYCPGHASLSANERQPAAPRDLYDPSVRRNARRCA